MAEVEQARDAATIAMMDALEVLLTGINVERDSQLSKHLHACAERLEVASAEQSDVGQGAGQKFRLFSPTQGETLGNAAVFYETQLPWTLEELTNQALAYLARCWTADTVTSPFQYHVVVESGATLITKILLKSDSRWPW